MKYPLIAFVIVALVIVGFALMFTNYNTDPTQKLNKVVADKTIDDCYDKTMDSWFTEFNANQNEGATMDEADQMASEKALLSYDECASEM